MSTKCGSQAFRAHLGSSRCQQISSFPSSSRLQAVSTKCGSHAAQAHLSRKRREQSVVLKLSVLIWARVGVNEVWFSCFPSSLGREKMSPKCGSQVFRACLGSSRCERSVVFMLPNFIRARIGVNTVWFSSFPTSSGLESVSTKCNSQAFGAHLGSSRCPTKCGSRCQQSVLLKLSKLLRARVGVNEVWFASFPSSSGSK